MLLTFDCVFVAAGRWGPNQSFPSNAAYCALCYHGKAILSRLADAANRIAQQEQS